MKFKLNKIRVEILLNDFDSVKEMLPVVKENIQINMGKMISENRVIDCSEIEDFKCMVRQIEVPLSQYTEGFPSYLRSVGKLDPLEKEPLKPLLDQVRTVLDEARELQEDLEWIINHLLNKIAVQNMKLGHFETLNPIGSEEQTEHRNPDPDTEADTGETPLRLETPAAIPNEPEAPEVIPARLEEEIRPVS